MASIQKTAKGYRAQIAILGTRDSKTFATRREAVDWANRREIELREVKDKDPGLRHTLREALRKYADEVTPKKRGARWEEVRLAAFEGYLLPLDTPIALVAPKHIALFRDSRLKSVSTASVRREISILSAMFETARKEWGWVQGNPCSDVKKPPNKKHRERLISWRECKAMLRAMDYSKRRCVSSTKQAVAVCFLVALRTGMRAGELCGLKWSDVHDRYCHLPLTKNGDSRNVPLSTRAVRLIEHMRGWDDELVFGLKAASLDALFRRYRTLAGLEGFTFHDSRHTAATMLSKKVDVLTLCKIFGWKDTKQSLTYYNPTASNIAVLLG